MRHRGRGGKGMFAVCSTRPQGACGPRSRRRQGPLHRLRRSRRPIASGDRSFTPDGGGLRGKIFIPGARFVAVMGLCGARAAICAPQAPPVPDWTDDPVALPPPVPSNRLMRLFRRIGRCFPRTLCTLRTLCTVFFRRRAGRPGAGRDRGAA